ncbi:MAG: glycosyltransferase family 4 protein [Luteimonas sp.]|nr:glycosyltransferase family 4 protein [Luteimonas sp.]
MKVVHVLRQFHPSVGGMEEVALNIARHHLAQGRDEVEVVTLDRLFHGNGERLPRSAMHDDIRVHRLPYSGSSRYPLSPRVLSAIRGADLVHVHGIDFFYDYLALTRPLHGKPMVVSTHGGFFHTAYASTLKRLWFHSITRASARAYRRVIATSHNDGDLFAGVVDAGRLRVIENGVDVEKFAGQGNPMPGKTLIGFGRWSTNKGIVETLDLLRHLLASDDAWRLILAGREFDLGRADLEREIARRGLQSQVELAEAPSQAELGRLIGRAQYFVSLSRHEGFGIAAIEAMSAGLVPILSAIPPYEKLVSESATGLLVRTDQLDAAGRAVRACVDIGDAAFAARRLQAMRHVARYDWRHVVGRYVDEYQRAHRESGEQR